MDGFDLSSIKQIAQDVFNDSPMESDEEDGQLLSPGCSGFSSAFARKTTLLGQHILLPDRKKSRAETERELELNMLPPNSIRRQILEQSLNSTKRTPELTDSQVDPSGDYEEHEDDCENGFVISQIQTNPIPGSTEAPLEEVRSSPNTDTNVVPPVVPNQDDEDDVFFDANGTNEVNSSPNRIVSEREPEQIQSETTNDEAFDCPYCFKQFPDFDILQDHVDKCYLKTPIDVNKSFFLRRTRSLVSSSVNSAPNQVKSRTKISANQSSSSQKPNKRRQGKLAFSPIQRPTRLLQATPSPTLKTGGDGSKMSFYQRFIESNSQSLSRSVKVEPLQCPFCMHGFLEFSALETHSTTCSKQRLQ